MWTRIMAAGTFVLCMNGLSAAHPQRPPAAPVPAAADSGRALFMAHCASCHGISARGDGPVAEALRVRPADLTQFAKRNGGLFPSAETRRIVDGRGVGAHGNPDMPVWGTVFRRAADVSDKDVMARIDAIVQYLESIQERAG
jgi:mono/diheme cytochrome c family protein